MGYSQHQLPRAAAPRAACAAGQLCPGGDYNLLLLLSFILHLPLLPYPWHQGPWAGFPAGQCCQVRTREAYRLQSSSFWWLPLHPHWQWYMDLWGTELKLPSTMGLQHIKQLVTLEAKERRLQLLISKEKLNAKPTLVLWCSWNVWIALVRKCSTAHWLLSINSAVLCCFCPCYLSSIWFLWSLDLNILT